MQGIVVFPHWIIYFIYSILNTLCWTISAEFLFKKYKILKMFWIDKLSFQLQKKNTVTVRVS